MIFDDEGQKKLILGLINNATFNGAKVKEAAAFINQVETAEVIPFERQMEYIKKEREFLNECHDQTKLRDEQPASNNGG